MEENMLLGKRPRPSMKRTTSLSEISCDLGETPASNQSDDHQNNPFNGKTIDQSFLLMVSPRNNNNRRRHSVDFLETPHFLTACGLCKRRLVPGRDIYMYRGDVAFCSLECRQQQMNLDERKEKCSYTSSKKQAAAALHRRPPDPKSPPKGIRWPPSCRSSTYNS